MNMRIGNNGESHNIGPIKNGKSKKTHTGASKAHVIALGAFQRAGNTNRTASSSMKAGGHTAKPEAGNNHTGNVTKRLFG